MKVLAKIIIVVAIFFAGIYIGHQQIWEPDLAVNLNAPAIPEQLVRVDLMIDYGNGEITTYNQVIIEKGASIFDLLKRVATENNLELGYKDYGGDLGVLVESISQIKNNFPADKWWQFWVDNEYAKVGASSYSLQGGEIIEWKYIKGQVN